MKKRGKQHSRIAVIPLGMKRTKYELDARAALLALENNVAGEAHLADLYVLASLCEQLGADQHILTHCGAVKRLCDEIFAAGYQCQRIQYASMEASSNLLLDWFGKQPNARIAETARRSVVRLFGKAA